MVLTSAPQFRFINAGVSVASDVLASVDVLSRFSMVSCLVFMLLGRDQPYYTGLGTSSGR